MTAATYSVVRYIGDPARNEALNVGILIWNSNGYAVQIDEAAVARVVRENPHLERDALLYLAPYLNQRLEQTVPPFTDDGFLRVIAEQSGFPVLLTEPRHTTVSGEGRAALEETLMRLTRRVVTPARRRGGPGGFKTVSALQRELKPLIERNLITRNHAVQAGGSHVPRSVDFYANSGVNIALDVVNFSLAKADDIRARADQQAFKIWDLLQTSEIKRYYVLGVFAEQEALREVNDAVAHIVGAAGGEVTADIEDAREILVSAADRSAHLFR